MSNFFRSIVYSLQVFNVFCNVVSVFENSDMSSSEALLSGDYSHSVIHSLTLLYATVSRYILDNFSNMRLGIRHTQLLSITHGV